MNTQVARKLVDAIAGLAVLAATFQAKYGKHYQLKAGSPKEAWTLYHDMLNQQRYIAGMLDIEALENPRIRGEGWWRQHDVIDTSATQELCVEAHMLLTRCVYAEANNHAASPAVICSQTIIAGLLAPVALQDPAQESYVA
jgi:hypothetical protein